MLHDQRFSVPDSPDALRAEYDDDLATIVDEHGLESAANETSVDGDALEAVLAGESPDLTLEEAAEIQALADGAPDAETVVEMACEHLLLGMSSAVLDVDALAGAVELDLEAKEIQQKIERRAPMSLSEFVHLEYAIVDGLP
ncbi:DUF5791 family protein [Natrarchaeobaculum aegyptiacum]|uniref:Uncharacterized protein n=1 Tax=Natrarchaeobaculum aegyptiacum TaxID=745377 RepID=A0A2Z2HXH2_9EURY|nr:DUF5791 family protein [Natrarchaeobaculum aegyptiacum]ARS91812.1 hypothetical protein B1756_11165 [Natrarchaeobaculum aegyptiacum]